MYRKARKETSEDNKEMGFGLPNLEAISHAKAVEHGSHRDSVHKRGEKLHQCASEGSV